MDHPMNEYNNEGDRNNNNNRGGGSRGSGGSGGGQPSRKPTMAIILAGLSAVLIAFMFWNTFMGTV